MEVWGRAGQNKPDVSRRLKDVRNGCIRRQARAYIGVDLNSGPTADCSESNSSELELRRLIIRILITGAGGYIGGRLLRALLSEPGFSVTAARRRAETTCSALQVRVVDWDDQASLDAACHGQEAIVHLAAINEQDCERDPTTALRTNGLATLMLLRAAQSAGVRRFVYLSTSKIFGANPTGRIDELTVPRPESHYAITHRLAEDYVLAAHDKEKLQGVVLRLSNSVGAPADPKTDAWMLIANDFCRQAAIAKRIALRSNGVASRNFIAMADTIAAIRHVLLMSPEFVMNGLFHLGGPETLRILDLALRVARRADKLFGQSTMVERKSQSTTATPPMLCWKVDKLMSTGWRAITPLESEIDGTLQMCQSAFGQA